MEVFCVEEGDEESEEDTSNGDVSHGVEETRGRGEQLQTTSLSASFLFRSFRVNWRGAASKRNGRRVNRPIPDGG